MSKHETLKTKTHEVLIQNKLIKILSVFSQEYKTNDKHKLDFTDEVDDPLLQNMLNRLLRAAASDEFRKKMDLEDEIERVYNQKLNTLKKTLQEKEKIIEAQDKALEEKNRIIAQLLAERQQKE